MEEALIYKEESYKIMGACFEVYKDKGCGFLEAVFQECLSLEFNLRDIPNNPKERINLTYKGHKLESYYEADFICYNKIIVELKAVSKLTDEHRAQLQNYLSATGHELGLLVNFGNFPEVEWERYANTKINAPSRKNTKLDYCPLNYAKPRQR